MFLRFQLLVPDKPECQGILFASIKIIHNKTSLFGVIPEPVEEARDVDEEARKEREEMIAAINETLELNQSSEAVGIALKQVIFILLPISTYFFAFFIITRL